MTTLMIFGGSGDLAGRLLLPAVANYLSTYPDQTIRLIGVGRDGTDYPAFVREHVSGADQGIVEKLIDDAAWVTADVTDREELVKLFNDCEDTLIVYYALPPSVTVASIAAMEDIELGENVRLALEKPFGSDADSARELEEALAGATSEDHIFRVDHFLRETATLHLESLVRMNAPLLAGWNGLAVERLELVFEESLGLEGRAEFYDATGAAKDMIQSHLLQSMAYLLAAGTNETPEQILQATTCHPGRSHRARYTAGTIDGRELPAYAEEEGVDPSRETETLAEIVATVDSFRWKGVEVLMRSGKAIADPRQFIRVVYRTPDELTEAATVLTVPYDGCAELKLNAADGPAREHTTRLRLCADIHDGDLNQYARVIRALITDDHSAEVPAGTPEIAWRILEPVLEAYSTGAIPLEEYPAGSAGPTWDE